jgi:iron-sulfur cluster protein
LNDYGELKQKARLIKEDSIARLPELILTLTEVVESRGGYVFLAKNADEANEYIKSVCLKHNARLVVKSKSITSEEIRLNPVLEKAGIEVAETDLAEFILQYSGEQPSHIVVPAVHRSRKRITELFKEKFNTDQPLETGKELTEFARNFLREKFLKADIGITGANMIAANDGSILLVESEGNIRLTTQAPAVHIALSGIEKIIPRREDLAVFIELLATSATGQVLTSYTNIFMPPLELPVLNLNGKNETKREFHLVLIDNGRMRMREDPVLFEALYCIRCSACSNSCANFQSVGGHAFGGRSYSGGIGASWTIGTSDKLEEGRFAELCTSCTRCAEYCPVLIDIPNLNTVIRNRINIKEGLTLQKRFFGNFGIVASLASRLPNLTNRIINLGITKTLMHTFIGLDKRRNAPKFAVKTLVKQYNSYKKSIYPKKVNKLSDVKTLLFADVYTNYNNPECGMAVLKLYDKLGIPVTLSKVYLEGRASQSQAMLINAARRAKRVAEYLGNEIDSNKVIIVSEPSVLALFRRDYKKLIDNDILFEKIKSNSYDPIEYIVKLLKENNVSSSDYFHLDQITNQKIFYHGHCQMKTIGIGYAASDLLRELGFEIIVSESECCGMAGSFGYKKEYYDVSIDVGKDLTKQITKAKLENGKLTVLASGISCREQIEDLLKIKVKHPVEFLANLIK